MIVNCLDDIAIPVVAELMVQPADDVHLGRPLLTRLFRSLQDLSVRHDVSIRAFQIGSERTEATTVNANVGRVEVLVDVVVGPVAVLLLSDEVGHLAEGKQIVRGFESEAVIGRKSFIVKDFGMN